jgi:hypothetical protein
MNYRIKGIIKTEDLQKVLTEAFLGSPGIQILVDVNTSIIIGPVYQFETAIAVVERIIYLSPESQAWFEPVPA